MHDNRGESSSGPAGGLFIRTGRRIEAERVIVRGARSIRIGGVEAEMVGGARVKSSDLCFDEFRFLRGADIFTARGAGSVFPVSRSSVYSNRQSVSSPSGFTFRGQRSAGIRDFFGRGSGDWGGAW